MGPPRCQIGSNTGGGGPFAGGSDVSATEEKIAKFNAPYPGMVFGLTVGAVTIVVPSIVYLISPVAAVALKLTVPWANALSESTLANTAVTRIFFMCLFGLFGLFG